MLSLYLKMWRYTYHNQKTSSEYTFEVNNIAYTLNIDKNIYNIQFNQIITISDDNYTYFIVPGDKLSGQQEIYINMDVQMTKEAYISFIAYVSYNSIQLTKLYPEQECEATFIRNGGGLIYYYNNKNGLFVKKI